MPPSGEVTFLFTDLEGSTRLWEAHPTAMHAELERHDAILRSAVEAHAGHVVKTMGDGVHAAFADAVDGLQGAIAAQLALREHQWGATTGPLRVRMALHTGEVLERAGDYYGTTVNRAARLMGVAHADQILVSSATAKQVRGTLPPTVDLVDLGQHRLRGLAGAEHVFQVRHPGLPAEFPSLESLDLSLEGLASQLAIPFPPHLGSPSTFVGRAPELARLRRCWDEARAGATQLALVGGEPGIGKTTLAARGATEAHAGGGVALAGHCDEELGVAYAPFVEAINQLVAHIPGPLLRAHVEQFGPHLARLVPALRRYVVASEAAPDSDATAERLELFASIAALLELVAKPNGAILVLDDIHWADPPTIALLRHLVERAAPIRLLVTATYRDSEVVPGSPLAEMLASLHRETGVERIVLGGMDEPEVVELLEVAAGQRMEDLGLGLAGALARDTGGNPFFVGELLRNLAESGVLYRESGRWLLGATLDELGLPDSIREVISHRVARLGAETQQILVAASVIGRTFDLPVLEHVLERDDGGVLDELEGAERAALVRNVAGDEFQFVHALVQQALYRGLGSARRSRLHLQTAEALEELGLADANPQEVAHHLVASAKPGALARAVGYCRTAGDRAMAALAPDEAVLQYREALRIAEQIGARDDDRCELLILLGGALRQSGDETHRRVLLDAASLAQRLGNPTQLASAVLANNRGWASRAGAVDHERVAMAEAALDAIGPDDSATRARLLSVLASELTYGGDLDRRRELSDDAVATARRIDDPATLSFVLSSRFNAIRVPHMFPQLLAETEENLELSAMLGSQMAVWFAYLQRMQICIEACDGPGIDAALDLEVRLAEELRLPYPRWLTTLHRASSALRGGELDECERLTSEALKIGLEGGQADAFQMYAALMTFLRIAQGRSAEVVEPLERSKAGDGESVPFAIGARAVLAVTLCSVDRHADAQAILDAAAADRFEAVPLDGEWMLTLVLFADAAAELEDVDASAVLFELLEPFGSQAAADGINLGGPVARVLGRLAAVLGRDADPWFERAVELAGRLGAPLFEAAARSQWAEVVARRA